MRRSCSSSSSSSSYSATFLLVAATLAARIPADVGVDAAGVHYAFASTPAGAGAGYSFEWELDAPTQHILLAVSAPAGAAGWIGWGMGEPGSAGMAGGDIVIVAKDAAGTWQVQDCHAMGQYAPLADAATSQDWELTAASSTADGVDTVFLKRAFDTGDGTQDRPINPDSAIPVPILYAAGACAGNDATTGACTVGYHASNRWQQDLRLTTDEDLLLALEDAPDLGSVADLLGDPYTLTNDRTHYTDAYFPNTFGQVMFTGFDAIVTNEATRFSLHHFVFYGERLPLNSDVWDTLFAWTPSSPPLLLPSDAGIRAAAYGRFKINTHYDNPVTNAPQAGDRGGWSASGGGLTDLSGVRVYLTAPSTFRPVEMGIMQIGDQNLKLAKTPKYSALPVGKSSYTFTCSYPEDQPAVNLYSQVLHMHEVGAAMNQKHLRNGVEIRNTKIEHYKFEYQNPIPLEGVTLEPGDTLVTECFYDTTNVPGGVNFGLGSEEEMCIAFTTFSPNVGVDVFSCVWSGTNTAGNVVLGVEAGASMAQSWGCDALDPSCGGGGGGGGDAGANGSNLDGSTLLLSDYFVEIFFSAFIILTVIIFCVGCYCCNWTTGERKQKKTHPRGLSPTTISVRDANNATSREESLVDNTRSSTGVATSCTGIATSSMGVVTSSTGVVTTADGSNTNPQSINEHEYEHGHGSFSTQPATDAFKARTSQRVSASSKVHTAAVLASMQAQVPDEVVIDFN